MSRVYQFTPAILVLTLLTTGVTTHNIPIIYAGIVSICIVVVLVAFGVLKENQHRYLLFAIALGMVFQLTLAGSNLIGPDVHLEYYWARFYAGEDVWYPLRDYCPAAGLGAVLFAPMLQKIGIPLIWTFKIVFPLCFAFVPVVLYNLFNRWVDERKSFIAAFAFIAFPTFLLEIPGIPEGMLAELFMVLAMYLVIVEKFRLRYRIPLIITCGLLAGFTHYSFAFILIPFLFVAFFTRVILHIRNGLPHKAMAGICMAIVIGSFIFFSTIASGMVMVKISAIYNNWVPEPLRISTWLYAPVNEDAPKPLSTTGRLPTSHPIVSAITEEDYNIPMLEPWSTPEVPDIGASASDIVEQKIRTDTEIITIDASTGEIIRVEKLVVTSDKRAWYEKYHTLMKTALGLDFANTTTRGKIFRIYLWITGLCMLVGLYALRKKKEFWIFAFGAILIAGVCLHPRISPILNASRFAHFALIALIPSIAVGGRYIFRNLGVFTICVMIPYFLLTSGFVFEVTKSEANTVNIPYSIGLSGQRLDLGASITENDFKVIDWLADHDGTTIGGVNPWPLFSDAVGTSAINEKIGYRPDLLRAWYKHSHLMPKPPWYAFIRERNIQDGEVVIYMGIGQRDHYPFDKFDMDVDKNIIYQVGEARVIYVTPETQWEVLEQKRIAMAEIQDRKQSMGEVLSPEEEYEYTRIRARLTVLEGIIKGE